MRMRQPRELVLKQEVSRLAENREPEEKPDMICGRVDSMIEDKQKEQGLEDSCQGVGRGKEEKEGREGRDRGDRYENQGEQGTEEDRRRKRKRETGNGETMS